MKYAKILNGSVENILLADAEFIATMSGQWVDCTDTACGIGWAYDGTVFIAPAAPPEPVDPCEWLIDLGPFYDRFGSAKMAVLTSPDEAVRAILRDVNVRKWVDLKRADVAQALAYVGSVVPSVKPALQTAILTTAVSAVENMALRKLYFS